ncbi:hypothetical protein DPMN_040691 [Dreissena polymorpha]|uniref:Uncharacterized protein n=1 Tax=Dreissena polymorpha TaxID=45954 RepID=A0A9D4CVU5_DREPO|nr:hypothetical protein DPMN_040691 [Dreissena polymorpha]
MELEMLDLESHIKCTQCCFEFGDCEIIVQEIYRRTEEIEIEVCLRMNMEGNIVNDRANIKNIILL